MSARAQRARGGEAARYAIAYIALFSIYGIVSPYLPILLRGLGYGPAAVGLLLALFEVVGIFGPLALTLRAEARPRGPGAGRLVLAGSALLVVAAMPGLAFLRAPVATVAFLALFAIGSKALIPLMDSEVVSYTSARKGGRGDYGKLRATGTLGFILVTLVLQFVPGFDRSPPWVIAACIGATSLAFAAAAMRLPKGASPGDEASSPAVPPRRTDPVFFLGLAIIGLSRVAMAPVGSFLSLYAKEELGLEAVGGLWALSGASEIPLMLVAGSIIARIGPMSAIAISSAAMILRLAAYAAFPSLGGIAAGQLLHSLCYGLFQPAAVAFVAERVPPERRATGMAAYMGFGIGLPAVAGSALGGFVIERWGYAALFLSFTGFAAASLALYAATRKRFGSRALARRGREPRP